MGTLPARRNIPPWVKVPEDLKDPEVFQVQTRLLKAMFGPDGSRIPYIEQVSKAMLELKALESSDLTEVVVYGSYLYKLRTKWMLQSMAEWHRQRQERGERPGDWVRGTQAREGRFAPLLQRSPLSSLSCSPGMPLASGPSRDPFGSGGPRVPAVGLGDPRVRLMRGGRCWTHWAGLSELS
ncbi:PREDICTED: developmental pluripotency-associated 5 protein isoform X1 [Cercocebus atys]|uniref:developmental pluripotency-associated 5 protein isoform X1 n=1 Tax=Cercocebus atys TaxID=9531 RepID=UPI0005F5691A|nr:PREDICTED: developmental pluripotency-associated 5 protein isoform X1 [Cercocebus atys]